MARSLRPLSNFRRRTSRIFRIDNLSAGMDTSLLKRGAIDRLDCRRTRPPNRTHRCSRSRGIRAHDRVDWVLMIPWNLRSRSRGFCINDDNRWDLTSVKTRRRTDWLVLAQFTPEVLVLVPLVGACLMLVRNSFNDWDPIQTMVPAWTVKNYIFIFTDPAQIKGLFTTLRISLTVTVV